MKASARANPMLVFFVFLVSGVVFSRVFSAGEQSTLFCVAVFCFLGLVSSISNIQDRHFENKFERPLGSVLTMERGERPVFRNEQDIVLHNLNHKAWYGHALQRANAFRHIREADGTLLVIAFLGNEPVGVYQTESINWMSLGSGVVPQ